MDLDDIKAIIDLMKQNDLAVFKLEREGFKLELEAQRPMAPVVAAVPPAAIATQTGKHATNLEGYLKTFLGRLHSLAATHELLSQSEWTDVGLRGLIERELAPYAKTDGKRLEVGGSPIALKPRAAIALGMVFHELATNSIKYGALSAPKGRLHVSWEAPHRSARQLELRWMESGGPSQP